MLELIRTAGFVACAALWLARGADARADGDDAPARPKPAEKGGKGKKDAKSAAATPNPKPSDADAAKLVEETGQGLGSFGKLLPLGQKNRDVKIPSFHDGIPSSFLRAATMTRCDDERMDMERLDIRMYGETEERDLRIMLPTATYHMPTEVLSSEDRSRISRKDFDLQGDTLIFDTRTQQGKMTGHIHMIIHDADSLRQQPDKPAGSDNNAAGPPQTPEKPTPPREKK